MRVRNRKTGVVMSVSDDAAKRLGPEWSESRPPPEKKAPAKKAAAKKPDDE